MERVWLLEEAQRMWRWLAWTKKTKQRKSPARLDCSSRQLVGVE